MKARVVELKKKFKAFFGQSPELIINSPGRAEIIGNHTDYNLGYALACAIEQSTVGLFVRRNDNKIVVRTTMPEFKNQTAEFELDKIERDNQMKWSNFPKAVVKELLAAKVKLTGANILVDTNFSASGGLSSSAAFELCLARGLIELTEQKFNSNVMAQLCQRAENSNLVQSPCGFLDQATIAFGKKDSLVFLDFKLPVKVRLIPFNLSGVSFVVVVDQTVKRLLGESGYPERRRQCEAAAMKLGVTSLREIGIKEFESKKLRLEPETRRRAEHVIYENQRVLAAVLALKKNNLVEFGKLLSASGKSALDLYNLDDKTPELRFLVETARELSGVLGFRNMGGGFSAIGLGLVKNKELKSFQLNLNQRYFNQYGRKLEFIKFSPGQGVEVV